MINKTASITVKRCCRPETGRKKQCKDDFPIADSAALATQERPVVIQFEFQGS